jgi:hypothetical protein
MGRIFVANEKLAQSYSLEYLEYMKKEVCCISFQHPCDLHHLDNIQVNRKKPNIRHFTVVPLNRLLHSEFHAIGIDKFQQKYKIQLWKEAFYYFAKWVIKKREEIDDEIY